MDSYIPDDVDELFANGPEHYHIFEEGGYGMDNIQSMHVFLEAVGVTGDMIEEDEGTQVILNHKGQRLCIDSYGLGDFYRHGFDVELL